MRKKNNILNSRNLNQETPLFIAARNGNLDIMKLLLDSGANMHLPTSKKVTPLHISVPHPPVAKLLIKLGSQIESRDDNGDTPLHHAVSSNSMETVCMLLYYNADANALNNNNDTPLTKAMMRGHQDIQRILLDYSDLGGCDRSFLSFAILFQAGHDLLKILIEKQAPVTWQSFNTSLQMGDPEYFRIILEHISVEEIEHVTFYDFLELVPDKYAEKNFEILLESPKIESFINYAHTFYVIDKFANRKFSERTISKFMFLLLTLGYVPRSIDIKTIFLYYGYTELLHNLRYINYEGNFNCVSLIPRFVFDVTSTVEGICKDILEFRRGWLRPDEFKKDLETFFRYCCVPKLIYYYKTQTFIDRDSQVIAQMPKIPSLVELARNKTREHIVHTKRYYTASQYYTYVNNLPLPLVYRKILMFETELYGVKNR